MLSLPDVTLIAVSSVELDATLMALTISSHEIEFAEVKFLTSEPIAPVNSKIKAELIPPLDFRGYSKFILQELHKYVSTPHCLVIQADGFVLNADRWQNRFLDYDYVGAPWPMELSLQPGNHLLNMSSNQVGNGGFSLRSKRLLLETAKIDFDSLDFPCHSEDLLICHYFLDQMLAAGIKFPQPQLAAQFSVESPNAAFGQSPETSFGFHGKALRDEIFSKVLS
ncbi:hypothetical protein SAMN06295945_1287 [Polynucleobacter meluiroseus]|uniref:DUF5672 domain-containing protein n=1 Tax=Polynucleobacter meluiroseus TaxID=1938814 RepID=A0A240E123_9BURK|nr:DUF5672 family protein [Polynucleobacter meluiroseus]SNX28927.1 hypothetical protein SAMN06295945_1287 [Polynucleobacter meluiroseus]